MAELRKIVLIDDEPDIRNIAQLVLTQVGGFEVSCADGGSAGVALVETMQPDLVLLDVMMPDMDGPATLKALLDKNAAVQVAFLTAQTDEATVVRLKSLGAIGVIAYVRAFLLRLIK